jgi:sec-independent protein translocase protein TatB
MGTPLPVELDILGWSDSLILMVMALVVFGPRKLPQIGRQIGKLMYEFRKASNEFKFQMEEELRAAEEADRRKKEEERLKALALKAPGPEAPALPAAQPAAELAAESTAPLATGSPYHEDAVYPPSAPAATPEPESAPAEAQPSSQAEETYPRILPPSTGEQVAAARPGPAGAFQVEAAAQNGTGSSIPEHSSSGGINADRDPIAAAEPLSQHDTTPAPAEEAHGVTEQAAHHG